MTNAYQHAMRAPGQSKADAQQKMCEFVNSNLKYYRDFAGLPDIRDQIIAYRNLGRALHPIMDSTSPAHSGFQQWDPVDHPLESFLDHGDGLGSIEGLSALTPDLLAETISRMQAAMSGSGMCGCGH